MPFNRHICDQVEKVVTTALDDDGPEPEPEIDEEAAARARW